MSASMHVHPCGHNAVPLHRGVVQHADSDALKSFTTDIEFFSSVFLSVRKVLVCSKHSACAPIHPLCTMLSATDMSALLSVVTREMPRSP